jgi:hypothetical protein
MSELNITEWRPIEAGLRDAFRRLGVPLRHHLGSGCDFVIAEFFDEQDERLLQVRDVFCLETLAKLLAGRG